MQQASEEFAYNEATMQYNYDQYSYNRYNDNNYPNNNPQNHDVNNHNHHQYVDENPDFPSLAVNSTTSITTNNSEKSFPTKASTKVSSTTSTALQSAPTAAAAAPHPLSIMHASRFGTSREALRRKEIQLAEQQRIEKKEQEARRVQRNLILAAALLDDKKESGNAINNNSGTAAPTVSSTTSKMFVPMNYSYAESQKIATKTFNSTTLTAANIGTTLNDETYVHKLTSSLLKYGWNEMMLMRTLYPKSLITWGKQNQSEVLKIERKLYMLLNDSKLNSIQFKPMTYPMRSIVHQLSRMYLLNSYEYDYQPNRYVSVVKQHDSYLPSYTLSKAITLPLFHLSSLLSTYSDYPTYSLNSNSTTIPEQSLPVSSIASSSSNVVGTIIQISTSIQESTPSISTQGTGVTDTNDKQCIIYLTINNESFLTQLLQTNSKSSSTKSSLLSSSSSSISSTNTNSIINNSSSTSTTLIKNDAIRIAFTIAEIIIRLNIILESQELWQEWYDYTTNTIFYNYNIDDVGNNSNSTSNSKNKHSNDKNSGKVDSNIIQEFMKLYRIQQHSLSAINICNNSKSNNNDNSDGNNKHVNNESCCPSITHLINCGASSIGIGFLNNTMVHLAYHFLKFCFLLQSNQLSKNDISSTSSSNSNINSSGKLKSVRNYAELSILSLLNVQGNFVIDDNIIIDMLYYGDSSSSSRSSSSSSSDNSGSCSSQQRVSVLFREFLLNNSNNSTSSSNQDFNNYNDDIITTTIRVTGKLLIIVTNINV